MTPKPYIIPHDTGTASSPHAVARRLTRFLKAMEYLNTFVVDGQIIDDLYNFRLNLLDRLAAVGWRVQLKDSYWKILPPKTRPQP